MVARVVDRRHLDPPRLAGAEDGVLRVDQDVQKRLLQQQRVPQDGRQIVGLVSRTTSMAARDERRGPAADRPRQHPADAQPAPRPSAASRRTPAGCGRSSPRDPLRGKSAADRGAAGAASRRTFRSAARDVRARPAAGCSSRGRCRRRTGRATPASPTAPAVRAAPPAPLPAAISCVMSRATST